MALIAHSKMWLFLFVFLGLREPPFLVPVLLWVFRNIHDWLLGLDLLQPPFHICTSRHLWSPGERRVCRDSHAAARALQEWPEVRGECYSKNMHTKSPGCLAQILWCVETYLNHLCLFPKISTNTTDIKLLISERKQNFERPQVLLRRNPVFRPYK